MKRRFRAAAFLAVFVSAMAFAASADTVDLLTEAKKNGITFYWDSFSAKGMLEKNGKVVLFRADDNLLVLDYESFALTDAPALDRGRLMVSRGFIDSVNRFFASTSLHPPVSPDALGQTSHSAYRVGAIVIDAGHGGKDPGANAVHTINGKKVTVREKDITLEVAKKLEALLKAAYRDKTIIMTRTVDRDLTLQQRADIANAVDLADKEAVLFVSVHVNASIKKDAAGFEVWYLTNDYRREVLSDSDKADINDRDLYRIINSMAEEEYTRESRLIARNVMDGLTAKIGNVVQPRGIKEEVWAVVRNTKMPAVLIEIGFLTNAAEAAHLVDGDHQSATAAGIAAGIKAFVENFEVSRGFTAIAPVP